MAKLAELLVAGRMDDRQINTTVKNVKASLTTLDRMKVQPEVSLPTGIQGEIAGLAGKLTGLSRQRVKLNVESATAKADVDVLARQLTTLQAKRHEIPVELRGEADKQIDQIERDLLAATRKQTKIPLQLERIDAKVAAVKTQLKTLERDEVDIPVEVDRDNTIKGKLGRLRESVRTGLKANGGALDAVGQESGNRFSKGLSGAILPGIAKLGGLMAVAFGGAQIGAFLQESITAASDLSETVSKSTAIFGANEAGIEKWASNSARSLGLSKGATLSATAALGDMFMQLGFTADAATGASKSTVQMAADLGSFSNLETGDVLERINAALIGEYDSLQKVIPNISAARVEQEAMAATGKKSAASLTAQEKAQAVLNIVQTDGSRAAGDFARTSGGLANQQKILAAQTEDLKAKVGAGLVPILAKGAVIVNTFLTEMQAGVGAGGQFAAFMDKASKVAGNFVTIAKDLAPIVKGIGEALGGTFLGSAKSATVAVGALLTVLAARKVTGFAASLAAAGSTVAVSGGQFEGAGRKVAGFSTILGRGASFLGGPWGIAIGIGVSALISYATKQSAAEKAAKGFTDSLTFQKGALDEASQATLAKALADKGALGAALKAGVSEADYTKALVAGGDARQQMITQLKQTAAAHTSTTVTQYGAVTATDAVGKAANKAVDELQAMGGSLDKSATSADQAKKATGGLADTTKRQLTPAEQEAERATKSLKDATTLLTSKNAALRTEVQKVIDKFTILKEGALDSESAENSFQAAVDDATSSLKSHGKSLDSNTAKGRENRDRIVTMIRALNDKSTADFKNTEKTDGLTAATKTATKTMDKGETAIRAAAKAAGFNTGEVDKMIRKMLKTPEEVKTDIKTPGLMTAQQEIDDLKKKIAALKDKNVDMNFKTNAGKVAAAVGVKIGNKTIKLFSGGGPVPARRDGGEIQGTGGPKQDNIAGIDKRTGVQTAWVSAKEFVVNAAGYAKNKAAVHAINAGKQLSMLANGGTVNRKVTASSYDAGVSTMRAVVPAFDDFSTAFASEVGKSLSSSIKDRLEAAIGGAMASAGGSFSAPGAGKYGNVRFSGAQLSNAAAIASVGSSMGQRAIQIGLMTAMQESTLRNLAGGDRDSVGLFQQRAPWGPFSARHNPKQSASMFFHGGRGGQRGLDDISGWKSMSLGQAAQRVQVSAFPGAYSKWANEASAIMSAMKSSGGGGGGGTSGAGSAAIKSFIHSTNPKRYVMGGVGPNVYDCSGLVGEVINRMQGRPHYRRLFTTASIHAGQYGLKGGNGGTLSIGVGHGHMVGEYGGLKFEAANPRAGVRIGSGAQSVNAGFATKHYHLAGGGKVPSLRDLMRSGVQLGGDGGWAELPDGTQIPLAGSGPVRKGPPWKAMASGGLVRGGRGGVIAHLGEGSRDELVTPLRTNQQTRGGGGGGDSAVAELVALIKAGRVGGNSIVMNAYNPLPETTSQSTNKTLQRASALGLVN